MSHLHHFLPLFYFISLFSISSAYTTTLSLSPTAAAPASATPWQTLAHLAAASSLRAHHLKQPKSTATKIPLYPRGYGGYSISLSFGTPPQTSSFVMDTGSSLVWFPCTQRYACNSCDFADAGNISIFIPKSSSSSKIVGCRNPKCKWIFPDVKCGECGKNSSSCNQFCPPYMIQYGSGSTTGLLLSESLVLPEKKMVDNFIVGCSIFSSQQPAGIAGFGRRPESLPAQMGLKRFSYCLVSHRFDGKPVSSDLVLDSGGGGDSAAARSGMKYTPFRKNPSNSNTAFQDYYYVTLRKITVGGVKVKVPYKYLVADSDGNGGTIVDSGTTFTYMDGEMFELVAAEFEKQIGGNYSRAAAVERESGLRPCYDVAGEKTIELPELRFHFKGGAEMALPVADYFSFLEESVICMTVTTSGGDPMKVVGPAMILGNYQQQNFYMEYDLENERLGFRSQLCK